MQDIDLLAIVTRPDFPSGNGPIGDHLGLARFAAERPGLVVRTIVLNAGGTRVHIEAGHALITQGDEPPIDLNRIRLVLYMPVSLEVEETNLAAIGSEEPHPLFAAQQWRPLTEYLEHSLAAPDALREHARRHAAREQQADSARRALPRRFPAAAHRRLDGLSE